VPGRSGADRFVGCVTDADPREVRVPLSLSEDGVTYAAEIVRDDSAGERLIHE